MIFTGNHGRRRAQNGQTNSQRRRSSNLDVRKNDDDRTTICHNKNVVIKSICYKNFAFLLTYTGTKQSLIIIEIVERQFERITEPQLLSAFPFLILIIRLI